MVGSDSSDGRKIQDAPKNFDCLVLWRLYLQLLTHMKFFEDCHQKWRSHKRMELQESCGGGLVMPGAAQSRYLLLNASGNVYLVITGTLSLSQSAIITRESKEKRR